VTQLPLIEYIKDVLKAEPSGWVLEDLSNRVRVAHFYNRPVAQADTYFTIGISHYLLRLEGREETRQEMLLCAEGSDRVENLVKFLSDFSDTLIKVHEALHASQVVPISEPILPNGLLKSVYVVAPERLGKCFAGLNQGYLGIEFVGLVPLYNSEAIYLKKVGPTRFETLFEAQGESFMDLERDPWI
jgi:hypothetical protein